MLDIKPFRALRPKGDYVSMISSLPYDVISRKEAADVIKKCPDSFLKVVKPESTIPIGKELSPEKLYDFFSDDGLRNYCWRINQESIIVSFKNAFRGMDSLYIAYGHHRVAAAAEVAQIEKREQKGFPKMNSEYGYFHDAVLLPQR